MKPPQLNELATPGDSKKFILPYMTPDQIDNFITFLHKEKIKPHQYANAGDNFKKRIFKAYAAAYKLPSY